MAALLRSIQVSGLALLIGCAGGGSFGGLGVGANQKPAKSERRPDPAPEPPPAEDERASGESDPNADQPVLVTGTYLTCGVVERSTSDSATESFGCRLAAKATGETVPLDAVATRWTWTFAGVDGEGVTEQQVTGAWQVIYRLQALDHTALVALRSAVRIVLDLTLRPGAGSGDHAVLEELLERLLDSEELLSGGGDGATDGGETTADAGLDGDLPGTGPQAPTPTPGPETETPGDKATEPTEDVVPPIVNFQLEPGGGTSAMRLMATLSDAAGVSDLRFGGNGVVQYLGADFDAGTAVLKWSFPVEVSLQKGGRTCLGRGAIGTGAMAMTLACR